MIIEAMMTAVKENTELSRGEAGECPLGPASAEAARRAIQKTMAEGDKACRQAKEEPRDVVDGETYHVKRYTRQPFFTQWGKREGERKMFQNASDSQACSRWRSS